MDASPLQMSQKIGLTVLFAAIFVFAGKSAATSILPSASFMAQQQVDLTLTKTGPNGSTVTAGSTISYQLHSTNKGPDTAYDVTVTDYVPSGLTFNSAQSSPDCVLNGSQVHCHVFSMAANEVKDYTVSFTVSTNPNFCNKNIVNTASISTSSTETNPADNQAANVTHTIDCASAQSDVRISKNGPTSVVLGNTILYTLTVTNDGPGIAKSVTADDTVPTGLTFNSAQSSPECVLINNNVICDQLPTMAPGASKSFTVAFTVNNPNACGQIIKNTATASVESTDPNPSNNISNTVQTTVLCEKKADLEIFKNGPSTASPGNTIFYRLIVNNNGPDTANNVVVTDTFPAGLTFNPGQTVPPACVLVNANTRTLECRTNSIASNAGVEFKVAFDVQQNVQCNSKLINNASVTSSVTDPNLGNNQSNTIETSISCPVDQADVRLTKVGPTQVQRGNTILYTLQVLNAGPNAAANTTVVDTIPAGLTFVPGQSNTTCQQIGNDVVCFNSNPLQPNAARSVEIAFTVGNNVSCNSNILNTASVSSTTQDPNTANNQSQTVSTTVTCPNATFSITKTDNRTTVAPAETLTYNIAVTNTSNVTATNVTVTDSLPSSLMFLNASDNGSNTNGTVTWSNLSIAAGQTKTLTIEAKVLPNTPNQTVLTNTATVVGGPTATDTTTVVVNQNPTFAITKSDGRNTAAPGTTLTYNIAVTNTSSVAASNVTVLDTLPSSLMFLNASNGGTNSGSIVTWNNLNIAAGQSITLTLEAKILPSTPNNTVVSNTATVVGGPTATDDTTVVDQTQMGCIDVVKQAFDENNNPIFPVPQFTFKLNGNLQTTTTDSNGHGWFTPVPAGTYTVTEVVPTGWQQIEVTPAGGVVQVPASTTCVSVLFKNKKTTTQQPTFTISKTDNKTTAVPGETLNYTITVTNTSSVTATGVSIVDTFPTNTSVVTIGQNGVAVSNGTVHWDGLTFAPNETKIFTLSLLVSQNVSNGTVLVNTATVTGGPTATDTTTIQVGQTAFSISKTDNKTTATPGETLTYIINVTNTSSTNATGVKVIDALPSQLSFVSATNGGTQSGSNIVWNNLSINAGQTATLTLIATVNSSITNGTVIVNTATVLGGPTATDTTTVTVSQPVLTISKTDNRATAQVGETLNYVITVNNTSSTNATGVQIIDTVPSELQVLNATTPSTINGQTVTWSNLTINANSQITLTVNAQVRTGTANNTVVLNTVQITGGNSATDTTTIQGGTVDPNNITIDLTDLRDPVRPDETFCYNIRLTNLNNGELTNLTVTQTLDSQTEFSSASDSGSHSSRTITWRNISIPANGTRNLGSCVRVDEDAEDNDLLQSTAFVSNKSDNETTRVEDDNNNNDECRIRSISDNPDPVRPGETLSYDIRIENDSNSDREFDIRAFLDSRVSFLSASSGGDDVGSREVEWRNYDIDKNDTETLRLTVRVLNNVSEGDTIRIQVHCENDSETESTRVEGGTTTGEATLSIDKSANRHEAKPGDTVIYTLTIRNLSNRAANNVLIQDRFTSGSISIEDAGGGTVAGNGINWTIPVLQANGTQTFSYRVRVGADMRHGQIIANTVRANSPDVARDATDIEEVRVITDLPQTGLGSFFNAWQKNNSYLKPSEKVNSQANSSSSAGAGAWATIASVGLMAGGAIGRRFWL